jgi:hypothetical protein
MRAPNQPIGIEPITGVLRVVREALPIACALRSTLLTHYDTVVDRMMLGKEPALLIMSKDQSAGLLS